MKYLLDSNVFIEAKNRYYAFDICPGFWDWMDQIVIGDNVATIQSVRDELLRGNDKLAKWVEERKNAPWILAEDDSQTQRVFQRIARKLETKDYTNTAISEFLKGADPWLVAKASCMKATVVTLETLEPKSRTRVPLPNVCTDEQVPFVSTFEFLRSFEVKFHFINKRVPKGL